MNQTPWSTNTKESPTALASIRELQQVIREGVRTGYIDTNKLYEISVSAPIVTVQKYILDHLRFDNPKAFDLTNILLDVSAVLIDAWRQTDVVNHSYRHIEHGAWLKHALRTALEESQLSTLLYLKVRYVYDKIMHQEDMPKLLDIFQLTDKHFARCENGDVYISKAPNYEEVAMHAHHFQELEDKIGKENADALALNYIHEITEAVIQKESKKKLSSELLQTETPPQMPQTSSFLDDDTLQGVPDKNTTNNIAKLLLELEESARILRNHTRSPLMWGDTGYPDFVHPEYLQDFHEFLKILQPGIRKYLNPVLGVDLAKLSLAEQIDLIRTLRVTGFL